MKPNFLKSVLKNTLEKITTTLHKKSIEYVRNKNPMHNFEQGAKITGQIREKVLFGFALKHHISIADMRDDIEKGLIPSKEKVEEKFNDAIIYLILEKASMLNRIEEKNGFRNAKK